uniref:Cytoplasmic tRNA 2-thiolation protein 2 n=1 Tax=Photinus pyralis TaxID=7054 RepID=A0A1Y1M405_PHOPY
MCSVGDDVDEEKAKFMQKKITLNFTNALCIKCRTLKPQVILHNQYPYCKACFLSGTVHKFKALLGKNRVVRPNESVLIHHKTGHASTALLHFLRTGLDLNTPKKIRFKPIIAYIENNYELNVEDRTHISRQVSDEAERLNFPIVFINLAQYVTKSNLPSIVHEKVEDLRIDPDDNMKIRAAVKSNSTLTTQTEIVHYFERELLLKVAKHLGCQCIFTTDLGIDIASQLLKNVTLGRGENIVYDTGVVDSRDMDVSVLRPLRNFTIKELALYNYFNHLEPVSFYRKTKNPYSSMQNLVEKFLADLHVNYPATISTIVRTGDKLGVNNEPSEDRCMLCKVPIRKEIESLGSAEATNFSHWISTQTRSCDKSLKERTSQILATFDNNKYNKYCYSCNQIAPYLCQ